MYVINVYSYRYRTAYDKWCRLQKQPINDVYNVCAQG